MTDYSLSWDFKNEYDSSKREVRIRIVLGSNHPKWPVIKKFPFVESEEQFNKQIKFVEARIKAYEIGLRMYPWVKETHVQGGMPYKRKFSRRMGHKMQRRKYPAPDKLE